MKKISDVNEALVYILRRLYDAENVMRDAIQKCSEHARSELLKVELLEYAESARSKIIKLERSFNYLMKEPTGEKNAIIRKMINDTHEMLAITKSDETRDIMLLACMQSIIQYKVSGYRTSLALAVELQLDAVADFLHEIIEWEKKTERAFS
ncbi:MAG TPA: DUF892 family protein, partial [Cyclobacteriaceae bacterium]|nr:DUF892 family protein [Cyclobacteriaceae bacterium]